MEGLGCSEVTLSRKSGRSVATTRAGGPRKRQGANPYKRADTWTRAAKEQGYQARSVFKLSEIDRRFPFLKPGQRVVDLGCYPGSWSQYALERVGRGGVVVGVDFKAPELPDGIWIEGSALDTPAARLREALGGPADVVLSDMAPPTTGVSLTDHVRQVRLVRRALALATELLVPGGTFVAKVFDGEEVPEVQEALRAVFGRLRRVRPPAVRQNSREFFLLCLDFQPPGRARPAEPELGAPPAQVDED